MDWEFLEELSIVAHGGPGNTWDTAHPDDKTEIRQIVARLWKAGYIVD